MATGKAEKKKNIYADKKSQKFVTKLKEILIRKRQVNKEKKNNENLNKKIDNNNENNFRLNDEVNDENFDNNMKNYRRIGSINSGDGKRSVKQMIFANINYPHDIILLNENEWKICSL